MENLLPYIATLVSLGTLVWGLIQHYDVKRREQHRQRFEQFRQVLTWVSGEDEQGRRLIGLQQLAAIHQLREFPELKHVWMPVLTHMSKHTLNGNDAQAVEFRRAIDAVLAAVGHS